MKKLCLVLSLSWVILNGFTQGNFPSVIPLDHAWKYVGERLSVNPGYFTSLAFSPLDNNPYLAFSDFSCSGNVTVMKFLNEYSWQYVGYGCFTPAEADYVSLAFNHQGLPYVAFQDWGNSKKASVMMLNGTLWIYQGSPGFSGGVADYTCVAFNPADGRAWVAYSDANYGSKICVKQFDGSAWVNVGSNAFTPGRADYLSLAFDSSGTAYIAFQDYRNLKKASVVKFDGTNWLFAGIPGFSSGEARYISLAINPADQMPYIAFEDYGNSQKATVMKFDGSSWSNAGSPGFSAGKAEYTSLAFSPENIPYVAFQDGDKNLALTVMDLHGADWTTTGSPGFSEGESAYSSLVFSPSGSPYVGFAAFDGPRSGANVMKYDSVYTGVKDLGDASLSIYPNPASDRITVELKNPVDRFRQIELEDLRGRMISTVKPSGNNAVIVVDGIPDGLYVLRITTQNSSLNWKVMIVH